MKDRGRRTTTTSKKRRDRNGGLLQDWRKLEGSQSQWML
jgi:hypothetical protein